MKFAVVRAREQRVDIVERGSVREAQADAGIGLDVDHGGAGPGLGIVVYEFGLYLPVEEQSYFAIGGQLYGGNAVLYAYDYAGETVDVTELPPVLFLPSAQAVEEMIAAKVVIRPEAAVNGVVFWRWPQGPPPDMVKAMQKRRRR